MKLALKEKFEARAKAVADAREIRNRADTEKRDMSAEEKANFDKLMEVVDGLKAEIDALRSEEGGEGDEARDEDEDKKRLEEAERDVEDDKRSLGRRAAGMNPEERGNVAGQARYAKAYRHWLRTGVEHRDLSLGTNTAGGFLLAPTQMSKDFVVALNNLVFIRALADIETLTEAKSLGVPQLATDLSDADWTAEVPESDLTADSSLVLSRRDLNPQFLCKLVLASHRLLQASSAPEQVINQRLAYKFSVSEEKAFLTGDGSGKPLGVFYASSDGIPTARDQAAASQTVFTADEIIKTYYLIPEQYTKSPSFCSIWHRDSISKIRQMKDGEGRYIWQMGIDANRPDTILGKPCHQSEYAPNTYTTGKYVGIFGDFKFYKIADVAGVEIQRLVERYAAKNQVGFLGRRYVDGSPVLSTAFARLKLG